jgi:hypothetical protein
VFTGRWPCLGCVHGKGEQAGVGEVVANGVEAGLASRLMTVSTTIIAGLDDRIFSLRTVASLSTERAQRENSLDAGSISAAYTTRL